MSLDSILRSDMTLGVERVCALSFDDLAPATSVREPPSKPWSEQAIVEGMECSWKKKSIQWLVDLSHQVASSFRNRSTLSIDSFIKKITKNMCPELLDDKNWKIFGARIGRIFNQKLARVSGRQQTAEIMRQVHHVQQLVKRQLPEVSPEIQPIVLEARFAQKPAEGQAIPLGLDEESKEEIKEMSETAVVSASLLTSKPFVTLLNGKWSEATEKRITFGNFATEEGFELAIEFLSNRGWDTAEQLQFVQKITYDSFEDLFTFASMYELHELSKLCLDFAYTKMSAISKEEGDAAKRVFFQKVGSVILGTRIDPEVEKHPQEKELFSYSIEGKFCSMSPEDIHTLVREEAAAARKEGQSSWNGDMLLWWFSNSIMKKCESFEEAGLFFNTYVRPAIRSADGVFFEKTLTALFYSYSKSGQLCEVPDLRSPGEISISAHLNWERTTRTLEIMREHRLLPFFSSIKLPICFGHEPGDPTASPRVNDGSIKIVGAIIDQVGRTDGIVQKIIVCLIPSFFDLSQPWQLTSETIELHKTALEDEARRRGITHKLQQCTIEFKPIS